MIDGVFSEPSVWSDTERMLNAAMAAKQVLVMLALLWLLLAIPMVHGLQDSLSDGYCITNINELADGSGIVANLKLISGSATYGPDLDSLKLTARYKSLNPIPCLTL